MPNKISILESECKKKRIPFKVFLVMLVFLFSPVEARIETPPDLEGAIVITAEDARNLITQGVLLVDSRVSLEFVEEHIVGAVSIPYKEKSAKKIDYDRSLDRFDLTKLPQDKDAPIIIYCNSGSCWKSYKACKAALNAGYKNIFWLRGGIPEWKTHGYPVE